MVKKIPYGLTEKQEQAVGAVIFWQEIKTPDEPKFNIWLAKVCIKLQTYF